MHSLGSDHTKFASKYLNTTICFIIVQFFFWVGHLHDAALPGLYMDAVNPDYLAGKTLNPELRNATWFPPTEIFPLLGNLYHGVQNYYVGLPVFELLGFNMLSLRVSQGVFASGILILYQIIIMKATGSRSVSLVGSLCLAIDMAFLASFRTQMYIVISGVFWLFMSLYFIFKMDSYRISKNNPNSGITRGLLRSDWIIPGVFSGLSIYSYFVFSFFVPALLIIVYLSARNIACVFRFCAGLCIGVLPYVVGYISLAAALGGVTPALDWLKNALGGLDPMSDHQGLWQRLEYSWSLVYLALSNYGNNILIFGSADKPIFACAKIYTMAISFIILFLYFIFDVIKRKRGNDYDIRMYSSVVLLPISFIVISSVFGSRLWAHHFSALIPLCYLILFLAISRVLHGGLGGGKVWRVSFSVALCLLFLIGNTLQQRAFFLKLEETGGVGKFSDAINRMADNAMSLPEQVVHVFPEWGFMMPFAFLTGNRRLYETDLSVEILGRLAREGKIVRIYYWDAADTGKYKKIVAESGFKVTTDGQYMQRDHNVAFNWMEAASSDQSGKDW
ncbi:glycosyltransferase family 39 protein [Martelella endophytica]|uniref:glycosyltransferase family 39 protein n=1 Tax=Martelella endophytica TaxID=1486262 RepID=UPI000ABC192B|nr:glycosyltransferase family 39 protein [Martelella endophytica]